MTPGFNGAAIIVTEYNLASFRNAVVLIMEGQR